MAKRENVSEKDFYEAKYEVRLQQVWFHSTHRKGEGEGRPLLETVLCGLDRGAEP